MVSYLNSGLLAAVLAAWQVSASPAVSVRMQAAFTSGPYLLELLYVELFAFLFIANR